MPEKPIGDLDLSGIYPPQILCSQASQTGSQASTYQSARTGSEVGVVVCADVGAGSTVVC